MSVTERDIKRECCSSLLLAYKTILEENWKTVSFIHLLKSRTIIWKQKIVTKHAELKKFGPFSMSIRHARFGLCASKW